ncbi:hypothetical protein D030_3601A, partial [Vibrio parahaemolyticus AQ3810]|jgi:hypothetical protein
MTG